MGFKARKKQTIWALLTNNHSSNDDNIEVKVIG